MRQKELSDYQTSGVECPTCGGEYKTERGVKSHHVQVHGESIAGVTVECAWCGGGYSVRKCRVEEAKFCSYECKGRWQEIHGGGENHPQYKEDVKIECEVCGSVFEVVPARKDIARACSLDCLGEINSRERRGSSHPLWTGGKGLYEALRREVGPVSWWKAKTQQRGGGVCEMCGTTDSSNGSHMDVHHIVPVMCGGDNHDENLMSLCTSCHQKAEDYIRSLPEVEPLFVE